MEKTLQELTKELEKDLGGLQSDPLFQAMAGEAQHEANEEIDDSDHAIDCDCCYYAFSEGDTPEGDL